MDSSRALVLVTSFTVIDGSEALLCHASFTFASDRSIVVKDNNLKPNIVECSSPNSLFAPVFVNELSASVVLLHLKNGIKPCEWESKVTVFQQMKVSSWIMCVVV